MSSRSGKNSNSEGTSRWLGHPNTDDPSRHVGDGRVVGIGAACDFATDTPESEPTQRSSVKECQRFPVKEFMTLEDGRRVVVDGRSFTLNLVTELLPTARAVMTPDNIRQNVLLNLLLDDDLETREDDRPWQYLAEEAREHGIEVTADELMTLPYEVVLAGNLLRWLITR